GGGVRAARARGEPDRERDRDDAGSVRQGHGKPPKGAAHHSALKNEVAPPRCSMFVIARGTSAFSIAVVAETHGSARCSNAARTASKVWGSRSIAVCGLSAPGFTK